MAALFDRCVKRGGTVRTRTLPGKRYMRICTIDDKVYTGEIKKKKTI